MVLEAGGSDDARGLLGVFLGEDDVELEETKFVGGLSRADDQSLDTAQVFVVASDGQR